MVVMATSRIPFGRALTAMVTPLTADGALDVDGAQKLASHLIDSGLDGLVVNGTTGEAPTTTDEEKSLLVKAVVEAVGNRAIVLAGVGTNDTRHTAGLARQAQRAGADGLLVVTPYYSRPPQAGLESHFVAVADATDLPVMLYDIPVRTGAAIDTETLVRLAEHPRIVAVKDAKDDIGAATQVLSRTDLAYYSGTDAMNLALLAVGAVGYVSVIGHLVAAELRQMMAAYLAGDTERAALINQQISPITAGIFRTQGVILTKAALNLLGLPAGPLRLPLVDATAEQIATLRDDLTAGGVLL
jgi:4-hydroxy-tetrahydrodipicolinate synthase